jgi:uncharacterized membrane protein HdeD (DUF308 family)
MSNSILTTDMAISLLIWGVSGLIVLFLFMRRGGWFTGLTMSILIIVLATWLTYKQTPKYPYQYQYQTSPYQIIKRINY